MAKQNNKIEKEQRPELERHADPIEVEEAHANDETTIEQTGDPATPEIQTTLMCIASELAIVADGASVDRLKKTVTVRMPNDKAQARVLFNQLVRMRDAADVAVRTATELMAIR